MGKKQKQKNKQTSHWPSQLKLEEALDVFEEFRAMCQHQMDLGYWATIDFPSKHHLNKLLSIQYMETDVVERVYGKGLSDRVNYIIPFCKRYLSFVREVDIDYAESKQGKSSSDSSSDTRTYNKEHKLYNGKEATNRK